MIIETLGDKRIFDYEITHNNFLLELTEACDSYFSVKLTKEQVIQLADDFMKLADQMKG